MSNGVKPVVSYSFDIDEVRTSKNKFKLREVIDEKCFTHLDNIYKPKKTEDLSLRDLEQRLNNYDKQAQKANNEALLKGLYNGGTSGVHNSKTAPFLFFDIDVKDNKKQKENAHLFNVENNKRTFEALKEVAVLVWRSNSGNGIAGMLYVPQIVEFSNNERNKHKKTGEAITDYLSKYLHKKTGIAPIKFDNAQSKFRQVRFLANQRGIKRNLNPDALTFYYSGRNVEHRTEANVPIYKNASYNAPLGSIKEQFNNDNPILEVLPKCGFTIKGNSGNKVRVLHPLTTSTSTGEVNVNLNVLFNYSGSFGNRGSYTSFDLVLRFDYNNDYKAFYKWLYSKGYRNKQVPQKQVKKLSKSIKSELPKAKDEREASELIYKYCYNLRTASDEVKQKFLKANCTRPEYRKYFLEYLRYTDYKISFDKNYTVQKYVSEALPNVLDYVDKNPKTIIKAETGLGKTTAILKDLHKYRPNARILLLEPLTVIVTQTAKEYQGKGIFLTGDNSMDSHSLAQESNLVVATYEQGTKHLKTSQRFDYVIIDEVHQLLTANAYKRSEITELTQCLENQKVIGLTGTPNAIFKKIGYSLIEVKKEKQAPTPVEVRYSNLSPQKLILNHIHNAKGKIIIRLNEIDTMKAIIQKLIRDKIYKKDEILLLHSTKAVKNSNAFNVLANESRFIEPVKIVFTTSVIDEGLSIKQTGFTDAVFLETSYTPRPEACKQFFARFRNKDSGRKNYLYLRTRKDQTPTKYKPEIGFKYDKEALLTDEVINYSTYHDIFSNDNFYYSDFSLNPYYLGYSVTNVLSYTMNANQFSNFLGDNYNLNLKVNKAFELPEYKYANDTRYKKQLKRDVAREWINRKEDVLNILALHSQDKTIRANLTPQQRPTPLGLFAFITNHLKRFEELYTDTLKLRDLGFDNPDLVLISIDKKTQTDTLTSDKKIKNAILLRTTELLLDNPKNKTDEINRIRLITFALECSKIGEITTKQLYRLLKKHKVYNSKAYNKEMLVELFKFLGYESFIDTNTKAIHVFWGEI